MSERILNRVGDELFLLGLGMSCNMEYWDKH